MSGALEDRKWDVFVSHASDDLEDARWVRGHLERAGWKCFLAHEHLDAEVGSSMWSKRIDDVLDRSGAVVVIVSPAALDSRWVDYEWRTFFDDIRGGRPGIVVPCCVDGPGPDELERALRAQQVVDLRERGAREAEIPRLLDLIEGHLKRPIGGAQEQRPLVRILSLEGTGARSLLVTQLLLSLEEKLGARSGPGSRIADAFDLVAGNSLGGLLACQIAVRIPAQTIHDALVEHLPRTFKRSRAALLLRHRFEPKGLDWMSPFFGERRLGELDVRCLVPVYDIAADAPLVLSSGRARDDPSLDFRLADVVRASCSSPTYFPPLLLDRGDRFVQLIDGSLSEPDPTRLAIAEARRLIEPRPLVTDTAVLSIGSGEPPHSERPDAPAQPSLFWWVSRLVDIPLRSSAAATRQSVADMFDRRGVPEQYVRLDAVHLPPPAERWRMDNTDDLLGIAGHAEALVAQLDDHLEAFLDLEPRPPLG